MELLVGIFCRIGRCRTEWTLAQLRYGFERCKHIDYGGNGGGAVSFDAHRWLDVR